LLANFITLPRPEDDIVVGAGDALQEEAQRREAVVAKVGAASRHWWSGGV